MDCAREKKDVLPSRRRWRGPCGQRPRLRFPWAFSTSPNPRRAMAGTAAPPGCLPPPTKPSIPLAVICAGEIRKQLITGLYHRPDGPPYAVHVPEYVHMRPIGRISWWKWREEVSVNPCNGGFLAEFYGRPYRIFGTSAAEL